jgi:hypothetical protein
MSGTFRPSPGQLITHRVTGITSRCGGVYSDGISLTATDGFSQRYFTSMYTSLEDILAEYRPATAEESARYERIYQDRTTPNYY